MRRTVWVAPLAAAVGAAIFFALRPAPASQNQPDPPKPAAAPHLPVAQTVLYSSGVAYFRREGAVEGSARVDLTFPVTDVNDLLKSLVLQDLSGGTVAAVSYDSQSPVEKTLQSYAVNLTGNPGFGALLGQLRGEKVEVSAQASANAQPGLLVGNVIGVEKQRQQAGKDGFLDVEMLTLWCAEGMRSVKLADVQRVRFLNPVIDNEFRRALETLALSHDAQKKVVSLLFNGEGRRDVRVAYVVENPIWKTSYRLVLPAKKGAKPLLQGWAMVENVSEEDWKDVRISLVSGRPISFRMDLYQPLYVTRPLVEPELFASLRPPTYAAPMDELKRMPARDMPMPMEKPREALKEDAKSERAAGASLGRKARLGEAEMDLTKGTAAAATAGELGDFFEYAIAHPVSLPRQKSALLPIVQKDVEADRVSIYNERVQAKHPLLGLRLKNTTGLHLTQGPITVFEGAGYAGDARILDLQPKEERLVSYAIDLGTEVEPVAQRAPDRLTKVKLYKGLLYRTTKVRESKRYNLKNRSEHDRTVLVEHPNRGEGVNLVGEARPAERARDVYRFEVKVAPGKAASLDVVEEMDVQTAVQLTNLDDETVRFFLSEPAVSKAARAALERAAGMKTKLAATQRERQMLETQLKGITEDQGRLRANLREMPPTAEAYKRYLKKFDEQETEIEGLQKRVKALQEEEARQRKEYDEYLAKLDVE